MSTHDYVIANQTGANTRSDLNNAFSAIVSNNSSATEPATMYAYQWWADTANDLLKQRNAANSAWIDILTLSTGAVSSGGDPTMGGDLTGTASNAQIAANAVTASEIADNAVGLTQMAGGTDGELITYDASGDPANVAVGTSGHVLTSGGAGVAPTFQAAAGGGKVLQVVQGTEGTSTAVSSGTVTYTGTNVSITPSATSSRILILLVHAFDTQVANGYGFRIQLSTDSGSTFVWNNGPTYAEYQAGGSAVSKYTIKTHNILLSPSTTSALTYKVYVEQYTAITINHNGFPDGSIIALEIGA